MTGRSPLETGRFEADLDFRGVTRPLHSAIDRFQFVTILKEKVLKFEKCWHSDAPPVRLKNICRVLEHNIHRSIDLLTRRMITSIVEFAPPSTTTNRLAAENFLKNTMSRPKGYSAIQSRSNLGNRQEITMIKGHVISGSGVNDPDVFL
ncbi:hypothetical protein L3X38_042801 [Prunus dulcis]|uniref:Uncharacterized protein n=1 Tax=Prunus dulcis TaxID=3755 RepID=A0AAD4UVJ2_PRUDU|nr:hypothetical protein L3X38_042801 [Prunus dulcis]